MWAQINGMNVKNFSPIPVEKGDILTLSFARDGCRAYIAVAGGLKVTEFMGSASTYLPAEFGGHEGRALQTGDVLQVSNRPSEAARGCAATKSKSKAATSPWPVRLYCPARCKSRLMDIPF